MASAKELALFLLTKFKHKRSEIGSNFVHILPNEMSILCEILFYQLLMGKEIIVNIVIVA